MTTQEPARSDGDTTPPAEGDQARQRGKRTQTRKGGRGGEGGDPFRQKPRAERNPMQGYGDGIERSFCLSMATSTPRRFPVQHRPGLAVIPPVSIARSNGRILLCDSQHDGPHIWPDGDLVD